MEDLSKVLGMKKTLSIACYPQTVSQIKRINQEAKVFLQYYIDYQQDNWMKQLLVAEFQYNDKRHVAINYTLFELSFRRHLWKGDLTVKIELLKLEDFLEGLQKSQKTVKKLIKIAKKAMKKQFDKRRQNP